ncbi:MAG: sugar porter family MFS transporter [Bacteroidales bacterium]|nr:sugar porter family MFS transporter [Bacteroidales bacterium]
MKKNNTKTPGFVVVMAVVAAMGGLLFGFDTGVISGAIPFLQLDFGISDSAVELITTAGLIGAIIGALIGGNITDRLGRRKVLMGSGVVFAVGALWSGLSASTASLIAARLFLGIAIGTSSFSVPLYIAEISPTKVRGTLVSLFQLMITIGILVSYFSDFIFANDADPSCWRPMFYVGVVPALILLVGMFFMPESPRWLMSRGRLEEAMAVLKKTEGENAQEVSASIAGEIEKDRQNTSSWSDLFRKEWKYPLIIAVGIMFIQQFVGINTVMYYSPKIFRMAGFDGSVAAIGASIGVGVINVIATLLSVYFVDRIGRRKLFFIGMVGMVVSLSLLAGSFLADFGNAGKFVTVGCTLLYVTFYAVSVGPLGWLIISEIFPQRLRGKGSSIGSLSVWVFNSIVTFTFFKIAKLLSVAGTEIVVDGEVIANPAGSFLFYAFIALIGIVWGVFFMPETKGKSLESIEQHWKNGSSPRNL